jgi:hypothetical protein
MFVDYKTSIAPKLPKSSQFVGIIGKTINTEVKVEKILQIESPYGLSWVHTMYDKNGNQIIWFCPKEENKLSEFETFTITAKVKNHKEFAGVMQTIVTHLHAKI